MHVNQNSYRILAFYNHALGRRLCLFITVFLFPVISFAQRNQIDSILKVLPTLKDTARIDCLHELSVQYNHINNEDSALYYANLAYEESKRINYIHGLAVAYIGKAIIAHFSYNDLSQAEQMAREAIRLFNLTFNKKNIALAYWQLSLAQFKQSNYDEALYSSKLCYAWGKKTGDEDGCNHALETMTDIYRERGEYEKLLEAQQEIIQGERTSGDSQGFTTHELWVMGLMNMLLEEYTTALSYWRPLFVGRKNNYFNTWNLTEYAQLLTLSNQPDSALYYYNQFDSLKADQGDLAIFLISKGEYYLFLKQYHTALPYFLKGLNYHRQANHSTQVKRALLDIGKTYAALHHNDLAISHAREGLDMALQTKSKPYIRDGYEILYSIYDRLHQTDSAYHYYHSYIAMKELVMNDQTKGKLAAYKYEHRIKLLDHEKLISGQKFKIQQQQFEQESFQKKILMGSIIGLILTSLAVFRTITFKRKNEKLRLENELQVQQLQNEKTKAELQQQAITLEMQALRAQINPHFIFNSLNAINRFILTNESEVAANYLSKFSRLMRMVLNNSQEALISLDDELATLQLYIDLEKLRFKNSFEYVIKYGDNIDAANTYIPSMLLQPFVENAILHGLIPNEAGGKLEITIGIKNDFLCCTITDNGIGRQKALSTKSKSTEKNKSLGLQITQKRMALLNSLENEHGFTIDDLVDKNGIAKGTSVFIQIKCKELLEEF